MEYHNYVYQLSIKLCKNRKFFADIAHTVSLTHTYTQFIDLFVWLSLVSIFDVVEKNLSTKCRSWRWQYCRNINTDDVKVVSLISIRYLLNPSSFIAYTIFLYKFQLHSWIHYHSTMNSFTARIPHYTQCARSVSYTHLDVYKRQVE